MFTLVALESTGSFYAVFAIPARIIPEIMEAIMNVDESFCVAERIESLSFDHDEKIIPGIMEAVVNIDEGVSVAEQEGSSFDDKSLNPHASSVMNPKV